MKEFLDKVSRKLIWMGIFGSFIFLGLIVYWLIFPLKVLEMKNVTLDRTEVSRGEHLVVSADYCKYINEQSELFISFIDGIVYNPSPQILNLEIGCHHANLSIYIPKALPTGEFMLKGVFRYKVNPIRSVEVNNLTGKFTIIK